jgi:hypothetical protein
MSERLKYVRRPDQPVAAVQLALDEDGFTFTYQKWGGEQRAAAGDWVVDNDGDVYTVNRATFERTYRRVGAGAYVKTTPIWAEQAESAGSVPTKEGATRYRAGDFLVSNEEDGGDAYAIEAGKFNAMYQRADT